MGFLSNFVNGAMNAGFNIAEGAANSAISAHYNKALMSYQSKLNRKDHQWSLEKSPTFQRQGLVDAGYNPILAFSQNTPSMGHVGLLGSSLGTPSAGKAFMQSQELDNAKNQLKVQQEYNKNVVENQKAEIENKKAQTQILKEEADEKKRANLVAENLSSEKLKFDMKKTDLSLFDMLQKGYLQYRAQNAIKGKLNLGITSAQKNLYPSSEEDDVIKFYELMLSRFGFVPFPVSSASGSSWGSYPWPGFPGLPSSYDPSLFHDKKDTGKKDTGKKDYDPLIFEGFKQPKAPKGSDRNPDTRKKQIWWKNLLDSVKYVRPFPL